MNGAVRHLRSVEKVCAHNILVLFFFYVLLVQPSGSTLKTLSMQYLVVLREGEQSTVRGVWESKTPLAAADPPPGCRPLNLHLPSHNNGITYTVENNQNTDHSRYVSIVNQELSPYRSIPPLNLYNDLIIYLKQNGFRCIFKTESSYYT